jgi:hypothetical protein
MITKITAIVIGIILCCNQHVAMGVVLITVAVVETILGAILENAFRN